MTGLAARTNVARVRLTINGESREVPAGLTVAGLIQHLGLTDGPVAVELNREVVGRAEHDRVLLRADDVIEIVHFVGGG
ncbi:MAG: sulfur carrier protein ThiS [Polyangiaceae bacterium]